METVAAGEIADPRLADDGTRGFDQFDEGVVVLLGCQSTREALLELVGLLTKGECRIHGLGSRAWLASSSRRR